uniref:Reverse transcriptase domain-containing protein n=1 Tax=Bos indicus x Bos taurus TaxID=30522 RepID=A0A4W2BT43_BOBOX
MLKILQARLQQYVNFQMFKLDLERAEEPEIKLPTLLNHRKSKRVPEKHLFLLFDYAKPLTVWITTNWKILQEMGIPDHLTCLLRNLYAGQEATVRTGHGTTDWFQIGKGVHQGCILSLCLFNLHVEYIMRNTGLEEAQAGIKVARRNINNLRYADDTTLIAESEEKLKSLLMEATQLREGSQRAAALRHPALARPVATMPKRKKPAPAKVETKPKKAAGKDKSSDKKVQTKGKRRAKGKQAEVANQETKED